MGSAALICLFWSRYEDLNLDYLLPGQVDYQVVRYLDGRG